MAPCRSGGEADDASAVAGRATSPCTTTRPWPCRAELIGVPDFSATWAGVARSARGWCVLENPGNPRRGVLILDRRPTCALLPATGGRPGERAGADRRDEPRQYGFSPGARQVAGRSWQDRTPGWAGQVREACFFPVAATLVAPTLHHRPSRSRLLRHLLSMPERPRLEVRTWRRQCASDHISCSASSSTASRGQAARKPRTALAPGLARAAGVDQPGARSIPVLEGSGASRDAKTKSSLTGNLPPVAATDRRALAPDPPCRPAHRGQRKR